MNILLNDTKHYYLSIVLFVFCYGFSAESQVSHMYPRNIFKYDLQLNVLPADNKGLEITLCCHGYGQNNRLVEIIRNYSSNKGYFIGFNFPDHDIIPKTDHNSTTFGSIDEILPMLYLMKFYACDLEIPILNLYGFSAGGGAVINALAILNKDLYQDDLKKIGISKGHIIKILAALEKGRVILDCPLKSIQEIIKFRGTTPELEILSSRYIKNNMNPIDVLPLLHGLHLNIILYFQNPDAVLSNRDDDIFVEVLKKKNKGITHIIIGNDGDAHLGNHRMLWNYYNTLQ